MPAASHWLSADRAGLVCVLVGRPILGGSVPCAARACPNWASGWLRFPSLLGCLVTVRVDARVAPVLACAALLVALAAADVADRSQGAPILPPGSWRWAWIGGVVTSFAAYLWTIWLARKRALSLRAVLVVAVAMQLAPLTGPLLLSSDVYSYWTYGRMTAVHGANPYSDLPALYPDDPAYRIVGGGLGGQTSIYGPGFTAASELHSHLVGSSAGAAQYLYRVAAAAGVLILLLIVAVGATRPAFAVAFIGLNPLMALHFAGGGHNDIWMLMFAVGAVLLARRGRMAGSGFLWAVSASVKASSLLLFPLEVLAALRRDAVKGARLLGWAIVGSCVLAALATLRYGTEWLGLFGRASSQLKETSSISSVFQLEELGVSESVATTALTALLVIGYLRLVRDAWNGRARLGLAAALLVLTPAWLVAWYGSWAVSFSAIDDDPAAEIVAVVATAYLLSGAVDLPSSLL